jgi:hypothetical protein
MAMDPELDEARLALGDIGQDEQGARAAAAEAPPADLSHAGAVVDKAIEYLAGQGIGPLAIASALLGGSLGLLARTMGDEAILRVLANAVESVRAGELREFCEPPTPAGRA